jgi:hypothetical protein
MLIIILNVNFFKHGRIISLFFINYSFRNLPPEFIVIG